MIVSVSHPRVQVEEVVEDEEGEEGEGEEGEGDDAEERTEPELISRRRRSDDEDAE